MKERLRPSDYRFIAVCAALLAATTWFSVRNFHRAFPEASIDFRVNREEGLAVAERFLAEQGYSVAGYREASRFSFDDEAKTFLEREAGLEEANRLMSTRVRLWRWSYRWFRPQQKEEYRVDITPAGEFAGFERLIREDAARPAAAPEQARALAEAFLRERLRRDPAALEFVEAVEVQRPHRVDRSFTWKERGFSLRGADLRLEVTLQGDAVSGYREYLKVPDAWTRDYQRLRSKNEMASTVDLAFAAALLIGLLATIVMRVRGRDIRWRLAATIGVVGAALSFLSSLNEFPLQEFGYPTADSYASFAARQLLQAALSALAAGGLLFVLTAGAEPLYREMFPNGISLGQLFRPRGLRTRRFFLGAILGISLTGVFIAYQIVFYVLAYRFGAWSPADVPYSDLLNTRFPWAFVLFGGFLPAVSEEFLFRMFGIPFLRKLTRSLPAAIVLAAFIWGFGHSAYAQQPFWIRGVEVGVGGVALGLIVLRWGILPALAWHYSVDAVYSAMLLLRSHSLYFQLSGAASAGIVMLPVLLALIAYWRRGGFEPETGLLNADEAVAAEAPPVDAGSEDAALDYQPLSLRRKALAAVIAVVCLGALLIPTAQFGESPNYRLGPAQARTSAATFLQAQGFDAAAFRPVAFPGAHWEGDDSLTARYFLQRRTLAQVSALLARYRPLHYWGVRFYKPLEQEEANVAVQPETGAVTGFGRTIPEDRPGADIPAEAARGIAAAFASAQGWDVAAMDLKESSSEKKKARRDHTLVWEARPGDARNVAEARYRVEIGVSGDRVTAARAFWKLPEAWSRERERSNALSIMALVVRLAVFAGLAVAALGLLGQGTRQGLVRWRRALRLAAVPGLLLALAALLTLPLLMKNYPTAIPVETYEAVTFVTLTISVAFGFLLLAAALAFLISYYPRSLPALRLANRRFLALDAAACLAVGIGLALALEKLRQALAALFPAQAAFSIDAPALVASASPALSALAGAVQSTLLGAAALAVIATAVRKAPRRWMPFAVALIAPLATLPADLRTPAEFALNYALALAGLAAAAAFCIWFARNNPLAYALVFWATALRGPMAILFSTGNPALQAHAWALAAAMGLSIVWAIYPVFTRRASGAALEP